jgi:uncharacterized SAM-binding protein YcdF (DUF218 family)
MFAFLSKIIAPTFSPIVIVAALLVVVVIYIRARPRLARAAAAVALALMLLASNSWFSGLLVHGLESRYIPRGPLPHADAIVVLASMAAPAFPPQPVVWIDAGTANRLLYAAQLYRDGNAPLVIPSGGQLPWMKDHPPMSGSMAQVLEVMRVPRSAIIQEPDSGNTYENVIDVKAILRAHKLHRILLVTSAIHMPRALGLFRHQGIDAIAAPCDFLSFNRTDDDLNWRSMAISLLPDVNNLTSTSAALKELLGIAAYRMMGRL